MVERFLQRYSLLMNARNHTSKPREGAQPMQGLRSTLSTFRVLLFGRVEGDASTPALVAACIGGAAPRTLPHDFAAGGEMRSCWPLPTPLPRRRTPVVPTSHTQTHTNTLTLTSYSFVPSLQQEDAPLAPSPGHCMGGGCQLIALSFATITSQLCGNLPRRRWVGRCRF